MNKNKARGKYFEDKIADDYREIFDLSKAECYRSSFSGARTSIEYNGDITFSNAKKYPIITECKYYQGMILDHFFPTCNAYVDEWLLQLQKEKEHYNKEYGCIPLALIIAGKPYDKRHHNVIIDDKELIVEDMDEIAGIHEYVKFYSQKINRYFVLIDYTYIKRLFEWYELIR